MTRYPYFLFQLPKIFILQSKIPQFLLFIQFYIFLTHSWSIPCRSFYIISPQHIMLRIHGQIFHYYQICCLILYIFSLEFKKTKDFYDQSIWVVKEIVVKWLCFCQYCSQLLWSYCFQQKFMIKSAKEKLVFFTTTNVRFLFHQHQILTKIKWWK